MVEEKLFMKAELLSTCSQAGKELVWTKASRQSMVFTSEEELTEIRIQTK
jgi:hypothetical protein